MKINFIFSQLFISFHLDRIIKKKNTFNMKRNAIGLSPIVDETKKKLKENDILDLEPDTEGEQTLDINEINSNFDRSVLNEPLNIINYIPTKCTQLMTFSKYGITENYLRENEFPCLEEMLTALMKEQTRDMLNHKEQQCRYMAIGFKLKITNMLTGSLLYLYKVQDPFLAWISSNSQTDENINAMIVGYDDHGNKAIGKSLIFGTVFVFERVEFKKCKDIAKKNDFIVFRPLFKMVQKNFKDVQVAFYPNSKPDMALDGKRGTAFVELTYYRFKAGKYLSVICNLIHFEEAK